MPSKVSISSFSGPRVYQETMSKFRGVDLSSSEVNVAAYRSPEAPNMMPDADGFPVKRQGFEIRHTFDGEVYGYHRLVDGASVKELVHAGTKLYLVGVDENEMPTYTQMAADMAAAPSSSWQLGGRLWMVDGNTYRYYDGTAVGRVSDIATVPIVSISKAPNGQDGATSYKPINLLSAKRTDSYLATAGDTVYTVSSAPLTAAEVRVEILQPSGSWAESSWDADAGRGSINYTKPDNSSATVTFTADVATGKVTFSAAPGLGPVTGEDSVRITYSAASGADKIDKMRVGILYGVDGAMDRLFLAGAPGESNVDRWSEWKDPTYFGDTFYSAIGREASSIMGYSVLGSSLVTHKRDEENGRNAFVRRGQLDEDGFAVFPITNVIQGEGAICIRSFASFNSEPLFLTERGVYALTPNDVTGERYSQGRSWYLDGALTRQTALENACCTVWGRFYMLAVGDRIYLLDGQQKSYEGKSPHSSYQYEGYYWEGMAPTAIWTGADGALWWGEASGRLCRLRTNGATEDYADDTGDAEAPTKPVEGYWVTPLTPLGSWSNYKKVTGVWVVAQPYSRSGGEIYYATDKEHERLVRSYDVDIFSFEDVDFDRWTFNTLRRAVSQATGKKKNRVKIFQVKVRNSRQEPFGINAITIQYSMGGKIKR